MQNTILCSVLFDSFETANHDIETRYKKDWFGWRLPLVHRSYIPFTKGIQKIEQGWIASQSPDDTFSEAVIVTYDFLLIPLHDIIEIHLHTHSSASHHSMRNKYRSAVYFFDEEEEQTIKQILQNLQADFDKPIITQVLPFVEFKNSLPEHQNYYYSNPAKPFCKLYIDPKLQLLRKKFGNLVDEGK